VPDQAPFVVVSEVPSSAGPETTGDRVMAGATTAGGGGGVVGVGSGAGAGAGGAGAVSVAGRRASIWPVSHAATVLVFVGKFPVSPGFG
jgi:hypothetical protein